MMTQGQLNETFDSLANTINGLQDINGVDSKVGYTYDTINKKIDAGFDTTIETTINSSSKRLRMDIDISIPQKKKIKNKKTNGLNTFQRITRQGKKLARDIKQIGLDKKLTIKSRLKRAKNAVIRVVRTEGHRIKEEVKGECVNIGKKMGLKVIRIWNCVFKNSRDAHMRMHKQREDNNGYFHIDGHKTKNPGGFGIAELDINCQCYTSIERI